MNGRSSLMHLYLDCRCGATRVLVAEGPYMPSELADSGWRIPTLAEEATGARPTCPACLAAYATRPTRRPAARPSRAARS